MIIDGIELVGSATFPAEFGNGDLCYINSNSEGNTPGIYLRIGGVWARLLLDGDAIDVDLDDDLDAIGAILGNSGLLRKTAANTWVLDTKAYLESNQPIAIKTVAYTATPNTPAAVGNVTIDWTQSNNYFQVEPTGIINFSFTAPPGPCHLQLFINSDGTSAAYAHTFPGNIIWYGAVWTQVANKKAIINMWYDGANYHTMGVNQV